MEMDIDYVGAMLKAKGLSHAEIDAFFEHSSANGTKWAQPELDPELEYLCHMLEEKGATDEEIDEFLEHSGVKGMKWGVRKTKRIQGNLDRLGRVRDGSATKVERLQVANRNLAFTSKGAGKALARGAKFQNKVAKGESLIGKTMFKFEKKRLSDLNYHQKGTVGAKTKPKPGSDEAKLNRGKVFLAGGLVAYGVLTLAAAKM